MVGVAALGSDSDAMWLCQPTNGCFFGIKFSPEKKKKKPTFIYFQFFFILQFEMCKIL